MDVSFILSSDEIYTLVSQMRTQSETGKDFIEKALANAVENDLSGLIKKNLARIEGDELILAPVIHMMIDSISNAKHAELNDGCWEIESDWITFKCEDYPYMEAHWKLTPIKGAEL